MMNKEIFSIFSFNSMLQRASCRHEDALESVGVDFVEVLLVFDCNV